MTFEEAFITRGELNFCPSKEDIAIAFLATGKGRNNNCKYISRILKRFF